MGEDFLTLDDVDVANKTVFVRLDINCPLDPETGRILDDTRIRAAIPTLAELRSAKVVIGSHQSRPLKDDFVSLEEHAIILRRHLGSGVKFVDDVMGPAAREAVAGLNTGEILVLDNLRLCSEEAIEAPAEKVVKTLFIRRLAPLFELYVNDAFAAIHRSQASLVGFAELMPAVAGRVMERELKALGKVMVNPRKPSVFVLGGVKVEERVPVVEYVLRTGVGDKVLLGGLTAELFAKASGYELGVRSERRVQEFGKCIEAAKKIMDRYGDGVLLPLDFALKRGGRRVDVGLKSFPLDETIMDVGIETVARYCSVIRQAGTVIMDGPLGVFEEEPFSLGTREVLKEIAKSSAYSLIGGGHTGAAANLMGLTDRISHISTGGGAMLACLAGQPLPAVEALRRGKRRLDGEQLTNAD